MAEPGEPGPGEGAPETDAPFSCQALVIGAGPAGLMATEELARAGLEVVLAEAKPSVGRKFLMAGKSGLNLTRVEDRARFASVYGADAGPLPGLIEDFGAEAVQDWARGLGIELFTGSTGRVFPVGMKASPLLRAWLARLDGLGVLRQTRWRWTGWSGEAVSFDTPEGPRTVCPVVTILALGGASWRRLGSDGAWAPLLEAKGVPLRPFLPANAGLDVSWSPHMAPHMGTPVKACALIAGDTISRGEFVISSRGLEGGGVYAVSRAVRDGAPLLLDLLPDRDADWISMRMEKARGSVRNRLRKALRLDPVRCAMLMEFGRPLPTGTELAALIKALPVRHDGLRPLDEAISTAGGIAWAGVDETLMLNALPGVFAAGEMLDWEAPTGGYLLTACLATGRHAGRSAAAFALRLGERGAHPS